MLCHNIDHNLAWDIAGRVKPCNWLNTFPSKSTVLELKSSAEYQQLQHNLFLSTPRKNNELNIPPTRKSKQCLKDNNQNYGYNNCNNNNGNIVIIKIKQ